MPLEGDPLKRFNSSGDARGKNGKLCFNVRFMRVSSVRQLQPVTGTHVSREIVTFDTPAYAGFTLVVVALRLLVRFSFSRRYSSQSDPELARALAMPVDHRDLESFREASAKRLSLKGLAVSDKNFNLYAKKSSKLR